jgi:hypothetical protein
VGGEVWKEGLGVKRDSERVIGYKVKLRYSRQGITRYFSLVENEVEILGDGKNEVESQAA